MALKLFFVFTIGVGGGSAVAGYTIHNDSFLVGGIILVLVTILLNAIYKKLYS